jgi:Mce-associated membrane protein
MTDDTSGPEGATSRTPTWAWIVIAVLGAALIFMTTLAVIQWKRADDLRHNESVHKAAELTAARFASALYTYDYTDLAAAKARVLPLLSDKYAKSFEANSPSQQAEVTRLKAKETAKVAGVFLTDVVGDKAAAVVILDTSLQSTAGNRTSTSYLDVALVRQGSTWKVDTAKPVSTS